MEDKIAERSVDYRGLAHEVSETNKNFIRKWAKSNLSDFFFWQGFRLHSVQFLRN